MIVLIPAFIKLGDVDQTKQVRFWFFSFHVALQISVYLCIQTDILKRILHATTKEAVFGEKGSDRAISHILSSPVQPVEVKLQSENPLVAKNLEFDVDQYATTLQSALNPATFLHKLNIGTPVNHRGQACRPSLWRLFFIVAHLDMLHSRQLIKNLISIVLVEGLHKSIYMLQ